MPSPATGSAPARAGSSDAGPSPRAAARFDPRRPGRLSATHQAALRVVIEGLARRLTGTLSTRLRAAVEVRPEGIHQLTYGEFAAALRNPSCLTTMSLAPLTGTGVLDLSLPLAFSVVERLCGGKGADRHPARRLSEVEWTLLGPVRDEVLADLGRAFMPLTALTPSSLRAHDEPQLLKAAPASCPVVVMAVGVSIEGGAGTIQVCVPFAALEPALDEFDGGPALPVVSDEAQLVATALLETSVDVSIRFSPLTLRAEEILDLAVGDVVALGQPLDQPLTLTASETPLLAAVAGRRGRRLACRIVGPVQEVPR